MRKRDRFTNKRLVYAKKLCIWQLAKDLTLLAKERNAGFLEHPDGTTTQIMVKAYRRDAQGRPLPGAKG